MLVVFLYLPSTHGSSTKRQQSKYSMFRVFTQYKYYPVQFNGPAIKTIFMKLIVFSFSWHCVREVLIQLCMLLLVVLLILFCPPQQALYYNATYYNNDANTGNNFFFFVCFFLKQKCQKSSNFKIYTELNIFGF